MWWAKILAEIVSMAVKYFHDRQLLTAGEALAVSKALTTVQRRIDIASKIAVGADTLSDEWLRPPAKGQPRDPE
jgi:hypothetical protein